MLAGTDQTAGEWQTLTLGDCAIINAATYSPKEAWPFVNYLDTGNITENRISEVQHLVAGKHSIPSRARRKVQPGDIVYSTVRPDQRHFGLLKDPPANCLVSTAFAVLRGKAGRAHTDFLYWFLVQAPVVERLHTIAEHSVTAYPSIRPADIARLELRLPPLAEQRAIAHILGTLDAKIEVNRRMNATLDEMAQALFTSWFVHFDPVQAKAALTQRASPGGSAWPVARARAYLDRLDAATAAVFPDRFVDSALGPIPAGWAIGPLADIAVSPRRGVDPTELPDDTPYIGLEHMPRQSVALTEWGNAGEVTSHKTLFKKDDILFGKLRPYFHKVGLAPVDGVCSTDIVVLAPQSAEQAAFVLACVSSSEFVSYTARTSTGTRMPRTSWPMMGAYRICRPAAPVSHAFQTVMRPLLERLVANIHASHALAALRDTLLPKLLSGQIRVHAGSPPS